MKISSYIIVFIVRGCFDRTHDLNINYFGLDARALLLYNYYNFHLELNASFMRYAEVEVWRCTRR